MNVLLVHNHLASFVQTDIDLLKSAHEVQVMQFRHRPSGLLRSISLLGHDVGWSDVVVSWFGGFHAFVAGLMANTLKKPHIIIASGYDVADIPEIDYGNMRPGFLRYTGKSAFRSADMILPVSKYTKTELQTNVSLPASKKVEVVHHGFCTNDEFIYERIANRIAMLATITSDTRKRKGIDVFIEAARQLPNIEFVLIGRVSENLLNELVFIVPPNLKITGFVDDANDWLKQTKVYAQLSRHEAFGCGLAEAMLQGCVPVVTDCAALPEVVGDTGFYTKYGDVDATVSAIRRAMSTPPDYGQLARQRIATEFPLEKRREKLLAAIDAVCNASQIQP